MKQIADPDHCTGCGACRLLCPQNCIETAYDDEGFYVPFVNETLCIECRICASRCPANMCKPSVERTPIKVFAARIKDEALLSKSSSGGVFIGIAQNILDTPGNAVFGCAFDEDIVARHVCVTDIKDIMPIQGSKYVQSDVGDTYFRVKEILENGNTVFYTGCPCQIDGLYAFLGKDYENLLTADLICHGVPSPLLLKRYINRLESWLGEKVAYLNFRYKQKYGWRIMVKTESKTKVVMPQSDPYYSSFIQNRTLRKSCYTCKYANGNRIADFTLGDFWGIEKHHPQFYDPRGVSAVLINSEKGKIVFEELNDIFEMIESTFDIAAMDNSNLLSPSSRPELRNIAYDNIENEKIDLFNTACYNIGIKGYLKAIVKKNTPLFFLHRYKIVKHKFH